MHSMHCTNSIGTAHTEKEEQLMITFIDCIMETFDHIFTPAIAKMRTSQMLDDSLRPLLMELEVSSIPQ